MRDYLIFLRRCTIEIFRGNLKFYTWMSVLTLVALAGLNAYCRQFAEGLVTTGMTDEVSWGVYIANFNFLVGVAAAAVMMVVPVYIYKDESLKDVVIFGELLAVAAIVMSLLFVIIDLGGPQASWHMMPFVGRFNWPDSMLCWDVVVLNVYLLLNFHICGYLLYTAYCGRRPSKLFYIPFVFVAIVWAVSIHSITAFLYVGLGSREFWHSAIVPPRFIASAFTSGIAFIILTLQLIRRFADYRIPNEAILKLRAIVQVSMIANIFFLLCELFKEFYTVSSHHGGSAMYLFFGAHGAHALVPWIWTAMALNFAAMVILVLPQSRSLRYLNLACVMAIVGIWIEKGMGLVTPAFIPTPLGEIVEYTPTWNETLVCLGVWAFGLLLYTTFLKMSIPILTGRMRRGGDPA